MPPDIRDAFFNEVLALATADRNVVFLTDDMDAFTLRRYKAELPQQFVNVGVAEQNMINVAAGLAMCGKTVFTYGIAPFVTMRCYEQIKVNLCSMGLGVTIIGVGAGFSFGFDGPTHHGTQDVSIMRALPEMTIYNPSDATLAAAVAHLAYAAKEPVYVRLDKGQFPDMGNPAGDLERGFRILRPLKERNIVATGFMTGRAVDLVDSMGDDLEPYGVVDLFRLKPIGDEFVEQVLAPAREIITLEENALTGGIGSIVAELAVDHALPLRVKRMGIPDKQYITYGSRDWFHAMTGVDAASVLRGMRN